MTDDYNSLLALVLEKELRIQMLNSRLNELLESLKKDDEEFHKMFGDIETELLGRNVNYSLNGDVYRMFVYAKREHILKTSIVDAILRELKPLFDPIEIKVNGFDYYKLKNDATELTLKELR